MVHFKHFVLFFILKTYLYGIIINIFKYIIHHKIIWSEIFIIESLRVFKFRGRSGNDTYCCIKNSGIQDTDLGVVSDLNKSQSGKPAHLYNGHCNVYSEFDTNSNCNYDLLAY